MKVDRDRIVGTHIVEVSTVVLVRSIKYQVTNLKTLYLLRTHTDGRSLLPPLVCNTKKSCLLSQSRETIATTAEAAADLIATVCEDGLHKAAQFVRSAG